MVIMAPNGHTAVPDHPLGTAVNHRFLGIVVGRRLRTRQRRAG